MRTTRAVGAGLALLSCSGIAAQTYVVDANAGPGTDYLQIRGALTQVPDGAKLIVRPGAYSAFTIHDRSITILCDPGATISLPYPSQFSVQDIAAHQQVVIRGLQVLGSNAVFNVQDCVGPVVLENLEHTLPAIGPGPNQQSALIYQCNQVILRDCQLGGSLTVINSDAVLEKCTVLGTDARDYFGQTNFAIAGIANINNPSQPGTLTLIDCDVQGGAIGGPGQPAVSALSMAAGQIELRGSTVMTAGNSHSQPPAPAIGALYSGNYPSTMKLDPSVALVTTAIATIHPSIQTTTAPLLHVTSQSAPIGGTINAEAHGPDGTLQILLVGLPGPPLVAPGLDGELWLDPIVSAWAAVGTVQQGIPIPGNVAIPNDASFRGFVIGWQSLGILNGFTASNASWSMVF